MAYDGEVVKDSVDGLQSFEYTLVGEGTYTTKDQVFEPAKCCRCKKTPIIFRNDEVDSWADNRWGVKCNCGNLMFGRSETEAIKNWNDSQSINN